MNGGADVEVMQVTDRPASYPMIRWDGSQEAADWVVEQFGDTATVEDAEDGSKRLLMWGSWEIPVGSFIMYRWGSFMLVDPADVNDQWQAAQPPLVGEESPASDGDALTEEPTAPPQEQPIEQVPEEAQSAEPAPNETPTEEPQP